MGNGYFKKEQESLEDIGSYDICDKIDVTGYNIRLNNENPSFFVCKNLK